VELLRSFPVRQVQRPLRHPGAFGYYRLGFL